MKVKITFSLFLFHIMFWTIKEEVCDQTRNEEICEERLPAFGDAWTKKCTVPPNIRDEVLREVLLHTSSPKVTFLNGNQLKYFLTF